MTAPTDTEWLNANQTMEEWGIARSTLTRWTQSGKLARRRVNKQWLYPRDGVAKAFYNSGYRIPEDDILVEEVEFFLGFGRSLDTVVIDLATSYGVTIETLQINLIPHYPELRGRVVRSAIR